MRFAQAGGRFRSRHIEIAQSDGFHVFDRTEMNLCVQLRLTVGIDRPRRAVFANGRGIGYFAVHCGGAGKDDVLDGPLRQRVEENFRLVAVVREVFFRLFYGLADLDKGREMDGRQGSDFVADGADKSGVADVALPEGARPARRPQMAVDQIVDDDRRKAGQLQDMTDVTADIAGAAGDKNDAGIRPHIRLHWPSRHRSKSAGCSGFPWQRKTTRPPLVRAARAR